MSKLVQKGNHHLTSMLFKPALPGEHPEKTCGNKAHKQQGSGIPIVPGQFGHVTKIHAVDAGNQHHGQEDSGSYGQDLQSFVRLVLQVKKKMLTQ